MEIINNFRDYLLDKKISNPTTLKNYLSDIRHFISWYEKSFGAKFFPEELSDELIKLYEGTSGASLSTGGTVNHSEKMSHASIKRRLSSLRQFARFAVESGSIETNPFELITNHQSPITNLDHWHIAEFKDYLKFKKASELTVKNYVTDIHSFRRWYEQAIEPLGENLAFPVINDDIIEEYKNRLIEHKASAPRTINRKLSSIRKFVEFAIASNFVIKDFFYTPKGVDNLAVTFEGSSSQATLSLNDLEDQNVKLKYSPFPPIRLFQTLLVLPYLLLEGFIAEKLIILLYGSKPLTIAASKLSSLSGIKMPQKPSDLLKVKGYEKSFYAPNEISLDTYPLHKRLWHHARHTRPAWYKKYHSLPIVHYIHFALLIIFATGAGVALYRTFVTDVKSPLFAAPLSPPRILSFQGRLTDNLDNPITTATDLRFAIYNDLSASGAALLWQEVHYDTNLDQDGIFSVLLGTNTPIPDSVFLENNTIYLGVTIEQTAELAPRRRIASVPYAANSEALQGMLPITDGGAGQTNVVLALDSAGDLTIGGAAAPTFSATGGQFTLSGDVLLLSTETGTNSDVIISPDGIGKIDVQKPLVNTTATGNLVPGGVEVNDKFGVLATESAVAAFIVNNNTAGGDIFTASSSGTPRFTVANDGALTIPVYNTAGGIFYANGTGGLVAQTTAGSGGQCLQSAGGSTPTWGTCGSGALWKIDQGTISPINDTLDFLVGSNASSSAKFAVLNVNSGTPVASISAISPTTALSLSSSGSIQTVRNNTLTLGGDTTGNIVINPLNGAGRVGINTSTSLAALDLRGPDGTTTIASISGSTNQPALLVDNAVGAGNQIVASKSGQTVFVVDNDGNIIVGAGGAGKVTAAIIDPYLVQNQYTTGNTQLTFQTMAAANGDFIYKNQSTELATLFQAGLFHLEINGSAGGLQIGDDTQLFRGDTNRLDLASGDSFNVVSGNIQIAGGTVIDSSSNATFNDITVNGTCSGCSSGTGGAFDVLSTGVTVQKNQSTDLLIGASATTSAKFAVLNVDSGIPTASVSATAVTDRPGLYMTGTGVLSSVNKGTLTIGSSDTGNIVIGTDATARTITIGNSTGATALNLNSGTGGIALASTSTGDITLNSSDTLLLDSAGVLELNSSAGVISIGNDAVNQNINVGTAGNRALTIGNANAATTLALTGGDDWSITANGDITSAGIITFSGFTGANDGGVIYANSSGVLSQTGTGSGSQCLLGGTTPTFGSCGTGTTLSPFQELTTGAIVPNNSTVDFLIGGQATTSAKFAVLNVDSGTPVASISAISPTTALALSSSGSIQTVRNNTLTLGGDTTGNIVISPLNGGTGSTLTVNAITTNLTGTTTLNATSLGTINSATTLGVSGTTLNLGNGSAASLATTSNQNLTVSAGSGILNLNTVDNGAVTTGTGLTTLGGNLTVNGVTTTFANAAPVITTGTDTDLTITPNGSGNLILTSDFNTGVKIGSSSNPLAPLSVIGGIGSNASFILDQLNSGDIMAGSASGITKFTIDNSGNLQLFGQADLRFADADSSNYVAFQAPTTVGTNVTWTLPDADASGCFQSNGAGTLSISTCGSGGGSFWTENLGLLYPGNTTLDLAIGGTSSTSAKFVFQNVNSGQPTFKAFDSASAQSINIFHDGTDGNITASTGTINIGDGGGTLYVETDIVNDTVNFGGAVKVADKLLVQHTESAGTALSVFDNLGAGDIFTASSSGTPRFSITSAGGIKLGTSEGTGGECLKSGGAGLASSWGACASQTPWTSDIDADGFDLTDLSNIEFRTTTGAPAGSIVAGYSDNTGDLTFNVLTGKTFNLAVNGGDEYNFSSTALEMNGNNITGIGNITAAAGLAIATTTTGVLSLDSGTTGAINIGTGANAKTLTIGNTTTTTALNLSSGTGGINIGDGTPTKTIDIGGNDSSAADTIRIATNDTAADVISIGNANAATTVAITGGDDWSITAGGVLTVDSCIGCSDGSGGAFDVLSTGVTVQQNQSTDLLIGASATTSAKFAILNVNGSGPATASVSGNFIVMPHNGAGGNVGIGTTSPDAKLHLASGVDTEIRMTAGGSWPLILKQDTSSNFSINNDNNVRLYIKAGGNVGIGTINAPTGVDPTAKLHVYSDLGTEPAASISAQTAAPSLLVTNDGVGDLIAASSSGITKMRLLNNGDMQIAGTYGGLGSDFAEYFIRAEPNEEFEAGDLVCLSNNGGVTKCSSKNSKLLGVVSDNALLIGGGDKKDDPNYVLVGLVGQVGVKVEGEVKKGDPLTISETSGVAKRAEAEGYIIGYAMEDNLNGLKPRVMTAIQAKYYKPFLASEILDSMNIALENGSYKITDSFGNAIDKIEAFSNLVAANIKAGLVNAQKITTNVFNASTASISNLTAGFINGTSATITNISTTSLNASSAVLGSVSITSENVLVAGVSLRDYIAQIVTETLNSQLSTLNSGEIISPTGEIDHLATNIISPLAGNSLEINADSLAINADATISGNLSAESAEINGNLTARNATFSGELEANTISVNQLEISENLEGSNASFSGTLSADRIIANTIDGLDDRISSIASQLVASNTQQVASESSSPTTNYQLPSTIDELEVGNLYADFGIYSQGLSVLGSITTAQLTAMDSISIGTGFILTDNSINTLGATLEIQPLRQGDISFMAGRVKIDTDGNVDINGNLNLAGIVNASEGVFNGIRTNSLATNIISPLPDSDLVIKLGNNSGASTSGSLKIANANGDEVLKISGEGNIVASGSATFDKLNFNLVGEALADSDLTATATGSAGFANVQRNKPEVTIYNDKITKDSLIYITPFGNTQNKVLHLLRQVPQSETADGSFTVGISGTPATIDIQFNWLIVN